MKHILFGICAILLLSVIANAWGEFPDPYDGYEHTKPEHGYWRQIKTEGIASTNLIQELHLHAEGYSVTWHPFEFKKDYWGTYKWDSDKGMVQFKIEGGNYEPKDFIGKGVMRVESANRLIFSGLWFGSPESGLINKQKSLVFERIKPKEDK